MNDLDPQARAIVEAARDADVPSAADHARIKRAVLVQIVAGTAVAGTAAAGTLSVGAKVGLAVLAVSVVGGGTAGVLKMRDAQQAAARVQAAQKATRAPLPTPLLAPLPVVAQEAPLPSESPVPDEKLKRIERTRKAIPQNDRIEKAPDEDQLNAEVALLKRAREELRLRRPERALETLAEHDRLFGKGAMAEERQAMAAIAACQARPGPAARAQAEAFMRRAPASPLRERVREACITPPQAGQP